MKCRVAGGPPGVDQCRQHDGAHRCPEAGGPGPLEGQQACVDGRATLVGGAEGESCWEPVWGAWGRSQQDLASPWLEG